MDDNELLRVLAKASGWRCTAGRVFSTDGFWVSDGKTIDGAGFGRTEEEAWQHVDFPDWLHSVDAALTLPWPKDYELTTWSSRTVHEAILKVWQENEIVGRYEIQAASTLARALCEVFAAWAAAQEAKEGER